MESLNDDGVGSKLLGSSHLDDTDLYTVNTEELPTFITAAGNFCEEYKKPTPFHVPTFSASARMFLGELGAMFVNHHPDSASEFVAFLNTPVSNTCVTSILLLHIFFQLYASAYLWTIRQEESSEGLV